MALTRTQLHAAFLLADEMVSCRARCNDATDDEWRRHLEPTNRIRAAKIRSLLDLAQGP